MSNLKINEDIQIAGTEGSLGGMVGNLKCLETRLNSYSLITAKANGNQDGTVTFTASYGNEFTVPLDTKQNKMGNWLELDADNNRIKVLRSGNVKVSGAFEGNFRGLLQLRIYRDGNNVIAVDQASDSTTSERMISCLIPPYSFYCSAGSYIYFKVLAEYGGSYNYRGGRTWLTVEMPMEGQGVG